MNIFKLDSNRLKYFMEEYTPMRQRIYVLLTILFVSFLSIFAFNARQKEPMNLKNTELKMEQPVGNDSTQIAMTKAVYNPNKNTAEFIFKGDGTGNDSVLTGNEIKFSGKTVSGKGNISVIPTINNQWVVLVSNLNDNFGGIQIIAESNIPQKPLTEGTNTESQKPVFSRTQNALKVVSNLNNLSPKSITLNAVKDEIISNKKAINKMKQKIKNTHDLIEYDQKQISKLQENTDSLTSDEVKKRGDTIENLRNEITTTKTNLTEYEKQLTHLKENKKQLKNKQNDVQNGDFKLPKVQNATKVGLKK